MRRNDLVDNRYAHPAADMIGEHLVAAFPPSVIALLAGASTKIVPLPHDMGYNHASSALRRLSIDFDSWPIPPLGLYVVEERTVYLRSFSKFAVIHETAHAFDAALGGGTYLSLQDARFVQAFRSVTVHLNKHAGSSVDEYFAESVRAFVGGCNDVPTLWQDATPERLKSNDAAMYALLSEVFAGVEGGAYTTSARGNENGRTA